MSQYNLVLIATLENILAVLRKKYLLKGAVGHLVWTWTAWYTLQGIYLVGVYMLCTIPQVTNGICSIWHYGVSLVPLSTLVTLAT